MSWDSQAFQIEHSAKNWNRGFGGAVLPALMRLSDVTLLVIILDNLFDKQLSVS